MIIKNLTLIVLLAFFLSCNGKNNQQTSEPGGSAQLTSTDRAEPGNSSPKASKTESDEFAFVVMGDSRGGNRGVFEYAITKALDHIVSQARTKLVVFTGDMVRGGTTADRLAKQLEEWNKIVQPYRDKGIEFLVTSGNHEIDDGTMFELEPGRLGKPTKGAIANQNAMIAAFPDLPKNRPKDGGLTYWIRRENVLLIVLDSFRPGYFNTVDTTWLKKILQGPTASPPPSHVFVATHSPAFPAGGHVFDSLSNYNLDRKKMAADGIRPWPWQPGIGGPRDVDVDWRGKRDDLWKILSDHKVTAFFAGHEHNLSYQKVDGVWQIVSGALTRSLYPENTVPLAMYDGNAQNPRAGNTLWSGGDKIWGYVLVAVSNGNAVTEIYGWTESDDSMNLVKKFSLD
ncbi:MAG: hypothetical protein GY847_03960 [Proteobacteria bacterium]|nr:hypothetical protein [Pseudomonadota bacterium]